MDPANNGYHQTTNLRLRGGSNGCSTNVSVEEEVVEGKVPRLRPVTGSTAKCAAWLLPPPPPPPSRHCGFRFHHCGRRRRARVAAAVFILLFLFLSDYVLLRYRDLGGSVSTAAAASDDDVDVDDSSFHSPDTWQQQMFTYYSSSSNDEEDQRRQQPRRRSEESSSSRRSRRRRPRLLIAQYGPLGGGDVVVGNNDSGSIGNDKDNNDDDEKKNSNKNASSSSSLSSSYAVMLDTTSRVNKAYARYYGHDYFLGRGIYFADVTQSGSCGGGGGGGRRDDDHPNSRDGVRRRESSTTNSGVVEKQQQRQQPQSQPPAPRDSRATYNKIAILEYALRQRVYDRLLLLDTDAMMYDFTRDIATAFFNDDDNHHRDSDSDNGSDSDGSDSGSSNVMLVGMRGLTTFFSWDINIGVTVWNLRHPQTAVIVQQWKDRSLRRICSGLYDEDQFPLQFLLWKMDPLCFLSGWWFTTARRPAVVLAERTGELGYDSGRFVKHFKRPKLSWNESEYDSAARVADIQTAAERVCRRYASDGVVC